jgi:catechol 2,3-dioxygenase-like lactoylglutathione lyase family enzyme
LTRQEATVDAPRIGNVLYPVDDLDAAVAFYRDALGLPLKFTDGDRYAGLDGGGTTLALVGGGEDVTAGAPAAAIRVGDVAAAVERATAAGATLLRGPERGPHEIRAALRDPAGNVLVLYTPA